MLVELKLSAQNLVNGRFRLFQYLILRNVIPYFASSASERGDDYNNYGEAWKGNKGLAKIRISL